MKKTMKKALLGILLLVAMIGLTGCNAGNDTGNTTSTGEDLSSLEAVNRTENENYTTYTDSSKVCFDYPSDWISLGNEEMPMFAKPDSSGTSVNMTREDILSSINFSGYVELAKAKVKEEMSIDGDIEQKEMNLNGRQAYELNYTATDEDSGITMRVIQRIIRVEDTVYVLTSGTIDENYASQQEEIQNILNSFRYEG